MQFTTLFTLALASVASAVPATESRQTATYAPCCYEITTGGGTLSFPGTAMGEYTTSKPGSWCTGNLGRSQIDPDDCSLATLEIGGYCASGGVPQSKVIAC